MLEMNDLSHWDFAKSFSAEEIALLILGVDPAHRTVEDIERARPILRGIQYSLAQGRRLKEAQIASAARDDGDWPTRSPDVLMCARLQLASDAGDLYHESMIPLHERQFWRKDVGAWLKASGMPSRYVFDPGQGHHQSADKPATAESSEPELGVADSSSSGKIVANSVPASSTPKAVRPEKNAKQNRVAEAIVVISEELGFDPPHQMQPHRGRTPGPKQAILNALRTDPRFKHLTLELNKDGESATFNAAWTIARKQTS